MVRYTYNPSSWEAETGGPYEFRGSLGCLVRPRLFCALPCVYGYMSHVLWTDDTLGFILLAEQFGLHLGEQEAVVFFSSMV